ncbi:MAG: universal stress protein [Deltaproteobacteria bacterium]|nr:universal stress protein [Deltaproteobacteria bacterium]
MPDGSEKAEGGRPDKGVILCPVRGGHQSARTVDRSIELALERSAPLVFLYVVDVDFLGLATVARVKIMMDELSETGSFALSILADKARDRGVEDVRCVLREGNIQSVIRQVAREMNADCLVIGRPVYTPGTVHFATPEFERFLESLRADGIQLEGVE